MRNKILLIALVLGFAQLTIAQEKSYQSTRSNKQTVNTKVKDSAELKSKANHSTTRSNKTTVKLDNGNSASDSINLKTGINSNPYFISNELQGDMLDTLKPDGGNPNESLIEKANHNTTRSNKTTITKDKDTTASKTKANINTSRSNTKSK